MTVPVVRMSFINVLVAASSLPVLPSPLSATLLQTTEKLYHCCSHLSSALLCLCQAAYVRWHTCTGDTGSSWHSDLCQRVLEAPQRTVEMLLSDQYNSKETLSEKGLDCHVFLSLSANSQKQQPSAYSNRSNAFTAKLKVTTYRNKQNRGKNGKNKKKS